MKYTAKMLETLKKMGDDAVAIQDACNPIAVINHFERTVQTLAEMQLACGQNDPAFTNNHPVVILLSDKLVDMMGYRSIEGIDLPLEQSVDMLGETMKLALAASAFRTEYKEAHPKEFSPPSDTYRENPAIRGQIVRIARLCQSQRPMVFSKAYDVCDEMKSGKIPDAE